MAFSQSRCGNLHESSFAAKRRDVAAAKITHASPQPAHKLMNVKGERTFVRNLTLDSFGHELHRFFHVGLPVAILASLFHGSERTHAAIYFVRSPLIENRFAGTFFGAG